MTRRDSRLTPDFDPGDERPSKYADLTLATDEAVRGTRYCLSDEQAPCVLPPAKTPGHAAHCGDTTRPCGLARRQQRQLNNTTRLRSDLFSSKQNAIHRERAAIETLGSSQNANYATNLTTATVYLYLSICICSSLLRTDVLVSKPANS